MACSEESSSNIMSDRVELSKVLHDLDEAIDRPKQFDQLKLAAECLGVNQSDLDHVKDITDIFGYLESNPVTSEDAVSILRILLTELKVSPNTTKLLPTTPESLEKCRRRTELRFAILVIGICNDMDSVSFKKFANLSVAYLRIHHQISSSQYPTVEKLFQLLFRHRIVWVDNVDVCLKKVLQTMGKEDCLEKVEKYLRLVGTLAQDSEQAEPEVKPKMERHQEAQEQQQESEGEVDEDSFFAEHKDLLEENLVLLCDTMEPLKVVTQLRKQSVFQQYDQEIVLKCTTSREQNEKILDLLYTRGPEAFDKFINCLKSVNSQHTKLAYTLQPIRYRILWFASNPSHAASVVHVLEKYSKAKFLDVTNRTVDSKYIVRRATIFQRIIESSDDGVVDNMDDVKYANEVEVCLVFPICNKDEFVKNAMSASFEGVCPEADLVVMSGVCVGVRGGVAKEGDLVFVDRATQPPSSEVSPCSDLVKIAIERIQHLFADLPNQPRWMKELYPVPAASSHAERARPKVPYFGTIGTSSSILEAQHPKLDCVDDPPSCLGHDSDTNDFFSLCQSSLIQGKPQFVCKGVLGDGERVSNCDSMSCTVRSSCVLMEVCRMFVERFRTAPNTS